MLQRIQTIFLVLVIILGILFSFSPILEYSFNDLTYVMNAYKSVSIGDTSQIISKNMGTGVLQGLVIIITIIVVLLYTNRPIQIKLCKLNILLIALQIAAIVMYNDVAKTAISANTENIELSFKFGAIIPIISLIMCYLAIHFIKKDDELVRSADRLR